MTDTNAFKIPKGELVPQCGHEMCGSQSRTADARILDFLNNNDRYKADLWRRS